MAFVPLATREDAASLAAQIAAAGSFPVQCVEVSNGVVDRWAVSVELARSQVVIVTTYDDFVRQVNVRVRRALSFLRESGGMGDVPVLRAVPARGR